MKDQDLSRLKVHPHFIIWQDEAVELEGQSAVVTPGMKGKVLSLHDGFHLDVIQGKAIPPKAIVQFDSGMALVVDKRMKWEKMLSKEGKREISE